MGAPLKNARYERFAQERVKGLSVDAAYVAAGFKAHRGNAHRLSTKESVKVRIAELQSRVAEKAVVTAERVVAELAKIAFASMGDFVSLTSDGDPIINLSAATPDQMAALSEVTVEDFTDGRGDGARDVRRVKIKLGNKHGALVDLGKHLGLFREAAPGVSVNVNVAMGLAEFYGEPGPSQIEGEPE
ncbi:MAG: terminase small subunit [Bradyrhizobium sp.]|jgi:phage terminase small subunit|uniref:terminase small subunit n=1 Tax=Sphingomonas sp. VL_57B TaxID=3144220 RepID=UPI0031F50B0D|nr:terminase small subunit [Bradyrhizobium sp.]